MALPRGVFFISVNFQFLPPPGGTLVFFRRTKILNFPQFSSNLHEIWHKSVSIGCHEVCQKKHRKVEYPEIWGTDLNKIGLK